MQPDLQTTAVVMERPGAARLERLALTPPAETDVVVEVAFSGISAGTERLLWSGRMPDFPGMGYPLVPGYETTGRVIAAGAGSGFDVGDSVFIPGAQCFGPVRGLFGGAASRLVVPGARALPIDASLTRDGTLLALAATAAHAMAGGVAPDLIVGHGVLGRLLARLTIARGYPAPTVWESRASRRDGALGYTVLDPAADTQRGYAAIYDASGDASVIDTLLQHLAPRGEIVLAGFYPGTVGFSFAPAFMREARFRCPAQWQPADLADVQDMVAEGTLALSGLITHCHDSGDVNTAYRIAFDDPDCLKMILDWSAIV